jgi:protein-disulfide isomerase
VAILTAPRLTRRDAFVVAGLIGGGYVAAAVMRASAPLGRDVSGNRIVRDALDDPDGPAGGAPDGNLVMAVYTDYRCPACRQAHAAMKETVAADGNVSLLFKDYPIFGAVSENAAAMAIASHYQGLYEPMHDRLMTGPASVNADDIRAAITAIGGDWARLQHDREANAAAIAQRLARVSREVFGLGIAGTPAYLTRALLVNGALSADEFSQLFRDSRRQG